MNGIFALIHITKKALIYISFFIICSTARFLFIKDLLEIGLSTACMRLNFYLVLLFSVIVIITYAQEPAPPTLNIGDPAPPLKIHEWLKGAPVDGFKKGQVYVVEFWATWCKPCRAAIPHLSALAAEYRNTVTFIGVDIYEKKTTSIGKIKAFVDSMGNKMDYHVATEESYFMESGWFDASATQGIPNTFVINAEGKLAWIGHPHELPKVLPQILNNTWDMKAALAKRNLDRHLQYLDIEASYEFVRFRGDPLKPDDPGKPDSVLLTIDEMVKKEPKLKFMPCIAGTTFVALLNTNMTKACEYGKEMLAASSFENPLYYEITANIKYYAGKLNFPAEMYRLGAETYQAEIDLYSDLMDVPGTYRKMAAWYRLAGDKFKAVEAEQKAVEALKRETGISRG